MEHNLNSYSETLKVYAQSFDKAITAITRNVNKIVKETNVRQSQDNLVSIRGSQPKISRIPSPKHTPNKPFKRKYIISPYKEDKTLVTISTITIHRKQAISAGKEISIPNNISSESALQSMQRQIDHLQSLLTKYHPPQIPESEDYEDDSKSVYSQITDNEKY